MIYRRNIIEKIKIKDLFFNLGVDDSENAVKDIKFKLMVNTPYGFRRIITTFRTEKQETITMYFKNNKTLKTSKNHLLKANGQWKRAKNIIEDDVIETETGTTSIKRRHLGKEEILYDISVEDVHCYYSNGILSHNSWILARLGAEAMKQGKNVVHYTLELNESYVGLRYDACFTGIDFQMIRKNIDVVKEKISSVPGKLMIKYYPIKTASANTLKLHTDRLQMLTGKKIDVMIVDYADILRPFEKERNSNSYSEAGNIYEELRTVAGENNIACWSASQNRRNALDLDVVQAQDIADSYRKVMIADFVMSLSRKMEDKAANTARFHVIKNRFGPDGITFPAKFNSSNGDILLYSSNSAEGLEIQKEMVDGENTIKNLLKNKWNNHVQEEE